MKTNCRELDNKFGYATLDYDYQVMYWCNSAGQAGALG
jgi:hypothetical protein